jgi:NAD(P)-dependent dehydrogenase (short-subunit alcohol dehydrogenase family)
MAFSAPSAFDLTGRVAVVTGALGKLGPIWCEALLCAGATVVGLDRPGAQPSPGFTALHGNPAFQGRLSVLEADVTDRESLERAAERCRTLAGVPEVLVNNAGIDQPPQAQARSYTFEDLPLSLSRQILDVNVLGTMLVSQVFGGAMAALGRGSIVNLGSLYASVAPDAHFYDHLPSDPPFLKPPAYGASKAAVVNLTRYLAAHWGPRGVRVNALSPGGVLGNQDPQFIAKFVARVPLGRMAVESDLGGPLLFLASDASAYVTGAEIVVDGGFTAW